MTNILDVAKNVKVSLDSGTESVLSYFERMSKEAAKEYEDLDYDLMTEEEHYFYDDPIDDTIEYENIFMKIVKKCMEVGFPIEDYILYGIVDSTASVLFKFRNNYGKEIFFNGREDDDRIFVYNINSELVELEDMV